MFDFIIAITLVVTAAVFVLWFLNYKAGTSKRRMSKMMRRAGLDPEIIEHGNIDSIMRKVRRQCTKCQSESLCERWLAGEEEGPNDFCPNARVFEELKRFSRA